jgi:hypothetical protein
MRRRGYSLVSLLGLILLISNLANGQSCTTCTTTSTGGNTPITLTNGQTLCINSGTFTGSIQYSGNATICVANGATLQPSSLTRANTSASNIININNYGSFIATSSITIYSGTINNEGTFTTAAFTFNSGTLNNHGTFMTAAATLAGGTINNYRSIHFKGNVTMSGTTKYTNHLNSYARFDQTLTTTDGGSNSVTITNQGMMDVVGVFTLNKGNNITLTNNGRLYTNDLVLNGIFNNNAIAVANGPISFGNGLTTNSCRFVTTNNLTVSSTNTFINNAFFWISGNATLTNSGTFRNSGYMRADNISNSGTIENAGGQIVVTGTSSSNNRINGGTISDPGNASNSYRFDTHGSPITAATGPIPLQDTSSMTPSGCVAYTTLPVKLVDFSATRTMPHKIKLKWIVAEEVNLHSYIVERFSEKSKRWEPIANVWPNEITITKEYSYTDQIASTEKIQYRLKMVDIDESVEYSTVKVIWPVGTSATPSLYPNPVSGTLSILGLTADAEVTLYDLNGQCVLSPLPATNKTLQINTTSLTAGVYLVKINQHGIATYHKIIKQP